MYNSGFWGVDPAALEEAAEAATTTTEPAPAPKPPCDHHKVYAAKNEGPYPWICSGCLTTGEDSQYPVCDSRLFLELQLKIDPATMPAGEAKLRACYYCGKHVHGVFSDTEPVRCGKCF